MRGVRVATWNVHGFVGRDGVCDVERTAAVLRMLNADVAALQEVDCRQRLPDGSDRLDRLAQATGLHATFGPTRSGPEGCFGNALLTRWPTENVVYHDVSLHPREPRGILGADLKLAHGWLRLLTTHFGLSAAERRLQHEKLLSLIESQHDSRRPIVVLGDFNEWRTKTGTILKLDLALGRPPYARSFPSGFPLLALDRIWVRPKKLLLELSAFREGEARSASDHLPVSALLDLERPAA